MQKGQSIGPFVIEREIGSGAMGTVYRARYPKTGLPVAIKVVALGLEGDPKMLARFERETNILKKLNHPNIVRLYASGRVGGKPFYAMEYVDGESLESKLSRSGRFSWEEVVELGKQICAGLQHAHEQGIVHRDLKPANIMLASDGAVKLTDFGIAKGLEDAQLTATHAAIGTASYMSPEQCRGQRDLTAKSDLYSLGVMFYQLLTGRTPFITDSVMEMFQAHVEGAFERPSRLVLDIPIWLDTLVCQMLEKDPEKRPLNAALVGESLGRIQDKVAAQRSAGADVVGKRVLDRPRTDLKPEEEDIEAARALKAGKKRKHLKRKVRPFYTRLWFQFVAIPPVLIVFGLVIWLATRPPSAEQLFQQAQVLMTSSNPEDRDKGRDVIQKYLDRYPDRPGRHADQMRAWADDYDVSLRERQLRTPLKLKMLPEGPTKNLAQNALHAEEDGKLDEAAKNWQALEKYRESSDPDERVWGLLAVRELQDLSAAQQRERDLAAQVLEARNQGREIKTDDTEEGLAKAALAAEQAGDMAKALDSWKELKAKAQADKEDRTQHQWALLASRKVRELTAAEKPAAPK